MAYKHLIFSCKRCGTTELRISFTRESLVGLCPNCKLVIFQIIDFESFKKEMKGKKCDVCGDPFEHKDKKKKRLPN